MGNLRLVDGLEVARMTAESGLDTTAVVLLGFEAADESQDIDIMMLAAVRLCTEAGGELQGGMPKSFVRQGNTGERDGIAGKWGSGFMKGGYLFTVGAVSGLVLNTFETAITWDRFFDSFHRNVL